MKTTTLHSLLALAMLAGCQTGTAPDRTSSEFPLTCPDQRPEVCTQQYDPVCALVGQSTQQTFSNACHACADWRVSVYRAGACQQE